MRLTTIAGIALLAVSTAALAQVARTPVEQKDAPGNAAAPADNAMMANTASGGEQAAGNDTGTPASAKTELAAPPR